MTKLVLTPEEAMTEARAMIAAGENVGFLFGPERAGLENADVARANAIVSVPVNPGYGSLNLGAVRAAPRLRVAARGGVPRPRSTGSATTAAPPASKSTASSSTWSSGSMPSASSIPPEKRASMTAEPRQPLPPGAR